ncbi:hypothetical protein PCA31118_03389 [Pandoraea captiosa]|uniref:Transmembrane protein n=1 Tax=Pandoraea captiosa TaxID=2508302 RepID=A0A5E5AA74_9BURK|nr:hypothetical protein [Pandoraea captiosa]VVE69997.1 hypothetical protein PCA31118_03389 [Pandoraea captiosa]
MEPLDEKSGLYKCLSFMGVCGVTMLIWLYLSNVESIPRVMLLMLCCLPVTLGLAGGCGWAALAAKRRVHYANVETCAFAGGVAGGALLFTIAHLI